MVYWEVSQSLLSFVPPLCVNSLKVKGRVPPSKA